MKWTDFQTGVQTNNYFRDIADQIRAGKLNVGRVHYALSLAYGVMEAIYCGYDRLAAIEFGVAAGNGLLDLCKAAKYFRDELGVEIDVYGLDGGSGLPPPTDYRDHPELWFHGQFPMGDPAKIRAQLPEFGKLLIGDLAKETASLEHLLKGKRLAFVSIDVDFYSSTKIALEALKFDSSYYLPAVPMFFDDIMDGHITHNSWCGEPLAINEFNRENEFRKIEAKPRYRIAKFYPCHILDHPVRSGEEKLRKGFTLLHLGPLDPKPPQ